MNQIMIIITTICGLFILVGGVISFISDTTRVYSIEQKSIQGDVPNATQEVGQFAADKGIESANDALVGAIIAVIIAIATPISALIYALIRMFSG